ncbi:MAG: hypothetical protein ABFD07_11515 [Methanobacterium sp.]
MVCYHILSQDALHASPLLCASHAYRRGRTDIQRYGIVDGGIYDHRVY